MPRTFVSDSGATFPATLADYKRAKAGELEKVRWATAQAGKPLAAPYPEIVSSWLANGFREVTGDGVSVG
jgi:hypothetical protein